MGVQQRRSGDVRDRAEICMEGHPVAEYASMVWKAEEATQLVKTWSVRTPWISAEPSTSPVGTSAVRYAVRYCFRLPG